MIVKFSKSEKAKYMRLMSSWEKLSSTMNSWKKIELSIAFSVEKSIRNREHILKRLAGRYNSIRAIKLN